jgi:pimeloyl-ACP methyl ester carboxylesterase
MKLFLKKLIENLRFKKLIKIFLYSILSLIIFLILVLILFSILSISREDYSYSDAVPERGYFVNGNDVEIFIQEKGNKKDTPILFIHGTASWSQSWNETMDNISKYGYRTIALDLTPFGFSEKPSNSIYSRNEQAKRILGVIKSLNLTNVILVGHSFGAGPTVEAVMLDNERISELIIVDGALGLTERRDLDIDDSESFISKVMSIKPIGYSIIASSFTNPLLTKTFLKSFISIKESASDKNIEMLQLPLKVKGTTSSYIAWFPSLLNKDKTALSNKNENYEKLNLPVSLIWGETDTITPVNQGEFIESLISNSSLYILPKLGHIPQMEDNKVFNRILLKILNKEK